VKPGADSDLQEKCLSQLYTQMPEGLTPLATLRNDQQRRQLGACGPAESSGLWGSRVARVTEITLHSETVRYSPHLGLPELIPQLHKPTLPTMAWSPSESGRTHCRLLFFCVWYWDLNSGPSP
jgi:hypothetical protein